MPKTKGQPGVAERTARAIRLKTELQSMLQLVVNVRERLENELADAAQAKFINKEFVGKLKDLASMYERLTTSHIQLLKAEKALEDDMTPAEEIAAVREFVRELNLTDMGDLINDLAHYYRTRGGIQVFPNG